MFVYIGLLASATLLIFSLFSKSYKKPFIASILLSPIISSTWRYKFAEVSLIDAYFVLFITIFLIRVFIKKEKIYEIPYQRFFLLYFFIIILTSLNIYMRGGLLTASEFFFKSIYIPFCLYLSFVYFSKKRDARALIACFVIAVIFPLIFIFFQKITGYTWRYHATRGIIRSQGVYHDVVTARIFVVQALIGIYLYWHYFLDKTRNLLKNLLVLISVLCLIALYFFYSKTIVLTLIIWLFLFSFLRKKFYALPMALGLFILFNSILGNKLLYDMKTLFSKEIEYVGGNIPSDYVLAGRGWIWKMYSLEWKHLPFLQKIIGAGMSHTHFHNDFLRVLYSGGILLLILYLSMILFFSAKVFSRFLKERKIIHFAALLGLAYYLVESLGQVAGFYSIIQPATWGLVGLSLNRELEWAKK